jgi:DNA-binding MarR family transcriptional regulator
LAGTDVASWRATAIPAPSHPRLACSAGWHAPCFVPVSLTYTGAIMDSETGSLGGATSAFGEGAVQGIPVVRAIRRPIDMDILPELLGYNVRCAQLALQRSFVRTMGANEIGSGIFGLLVLAGANPGIAQIQIATHLNVDKASVVSMVDKLEESGWLVRRRAAHDRRRYGLFLTPEGTRQLKQLKTQMQEREQGLSALYNEEERRQLISLLQRMRP